MADLVLAWANYLGDVVLAGVLTVYGVMADVYSAVMNE